MAPWVWAIIVSWAGICLVSIVRTITIHCFLASHTPAPGRVCPVGEWPSLHVVIPARNEQQGLGACLEAVLGQDYPDLRVTLVNDRSDDDTLAVAQSYAERDSRLDILNIEKLPEDEMWLGKAHAMWRAAGKSTSQWLLFIDVDVTLDADALKTAVCEGLEKQVELLTLFPRAAASGFWPQVAIPFLGSILLIWFDPLRVNHPRPRTGFVNGQFLLIQRDVYERLDGHRAVRKFIIEDVPFGQHAKKNGVRCRVVSGLKIAQVRMYSGLPQIVRGFSRILIGAVRSRVKLALTLLILASAIWPFVAGLALSITWLSGNVAEGGLLSPDGFTVLCGLCLFQLASAFGFNARVLSSSGLSHFWILLYPVSILVALVTVIHAMLNFSRVEWRGIDYKVDRQGQIVA